MPPCSCEAKSAGPSTHKAPIHLSTCPHSMLERTTRSFRKLPKARKVPGTRRVIFEEDLDEAIYG